LNPSPGTPIVSVLVTCFKYLKRLKVCLESLARQDLPEYGLEVVIADPESPDGLAAWLNEFAELHPRLKVTHVPLHSRYHRNRGFAINRAYDASGGRIIVSIDGDIVFPPHLMRLLAEQLSARPNTVFGVRRAFLPKDVTEAIIEGRLDPSTEFQALSESPGDGEEYPFVGVLGYCQAVTREAFARARYPEEFDRVNQSDIVFVERLETHAGVRPLLLADQVVLHLWHPRNWMGTSDFL
jgi:glycosyltransferase involved in cell wall biosynthesis